MIIEYSIKYIEFCMMNMMINQYENFMLTNLFINYSIKNIVILMILKIFIHEKFLFLNFYIFCIVIY